MIVDTTIFKGYDIRGVYPESINEEIAYKIGYAYASLNKPKKEVLVGHDVRIHSKSLKDQIVKGLTDAGASVIDVGWISTDMLYFGVGYYKTDGGIAVTASHNPPEWHGAKMVKANVIPMTLETGIGDIRDFIVKYKKYSIVKKGSVRRYSNILDDYSKYILSWINPNKIKPFRIVINPNFGYGGLIFKNIVKLGNLPLEIIELNCEPDGNFPKGRPDPFIPENRIEFSHLVKSSNADLGITWDADSDRVFFCADGGLFVVPYHLNTLLIEYMLKKNKGRKVIYDIRYTWGLLDSIKKYGGKPVMCRVGHSYIKEKMREVNALFAVESSGHTYYRDYWYSDCGMIPPLQILEYLSEKSEKLSKIIKPVIIKYPIYDEVNSEVKDKEAKIEEIAKKYKGGKQSRLDGICVEYDDFRFVVRPSNTESLLRLTLEAKNEKIVKEKVDELLKIIRS